MKKNKVAVFETDYRDIDRFYTSVIGQEYIDYVLIDDNNDYQKYLKYGQIKADKVFCVAWFSHKRLLSFLILNGITHLIVNAHRIIDINIILIAKKSGIKVLYIQHGLYIPYMHRSKTLFVKQFIKALRYLYYAILCSIEVKDYKFGLNLFKVHVLGTDRKYFQQYQNVFPDKSFVYSDYWKQWHVDYYVFPEKSIIVNGNLDLLKFQFSEYYGDNSVCYCYQTLVEDGRIQEDIMYHFYGQLLDWVKIKDYKLVIKFHPRGHERHAQYFKDAGAIIELDFVPNTKIVIGHYSSLLFFWGTEGTPVNIFSLEGHDIPSSIECWSNRCTTFDDVTLSPPNVSLCKEQIGSKFDINFFLSNLL